MAADIKEAVDFLRLVSDAEAHNRSSALEDLKFGAGDQWPNYAIQSRGLDRPQLTINETDAYIKQVCNQQRQQRPKGKAHPVDSLADPKIAEVITGLIRHIELQSDSDAAYDTAFEFAVRMGWGYWRIVTDYIREDSFDQDIYIRQIENPFTVYFDPNSSLRDGSDSEKCLITDLIPKKIFEKLYPGAELSQFNNRATGDSTIDWITQHDIRIAEYFHVEKTKDTLIMLSDKQTLWKDELPDPALLQAAQITVVGDRQSYRRKVKWQKQTGAEILEEKDWPGRWIPIIPVYGSQLVLEGRKERYGLIRFAKDPQRMVNFWNTAFTEAVAMAPKAKWLMAEGQDEGHENEWAKANISVVPVLRHKQTDVEGQPAPPPQRIQPEPPPEGILQGAAMASQNLQKIIGMFDPAVREGGPKSGKAIRAEQLQQDQSNFHFYDNLTCSIKHTCRQILDLVPKVYDQERVSRIVGDDGKPDLITLNQKQSSEAEAKVLNDVTVGTYDVVMDTGPGYNSKRQEALETFTTLMSGPLGEEIAKVGSDLIVRLTDAPGMDALADRLAASNPMAQIDDKSDVPPQAQMMIKQLQQQLQQLQQQLQQAGMEIKFRHGIEQMKQVGEDRRLKEKETGETKRELMRVTSKAHDVEMRDASKQHDTEIQARTKMHDTAMRTQTQAHDAAMKSQTAMDVEELRGHIALLLARIDSESKHRAAEETADKAI